MHGLSLQMPAAAMQVKLRRVNTENVNRHFFYRKLNSAELAGKPMFENINTSGGSLSPLN